MAQMAKLCVDKSPTLLPSGLDREQPAVPRWYAVQAHVRSELQAVSQLTSKGVEAFLPSYQEVRKWSDRTKLFIKPLIPGYVFVRVILSGQIKLRTLETFGVHSFVAFAGVSPFIPDEQMLYLKQLSENNIRASAFPGTLQTGQRVRIRNGCLAGIEGMLVVTPESKVITIFIESIHQSIRIAADDLDFGPL